MVTVDETEKPQNDAGALTCCECGFDFLNPEYLVGTYANEDMRPIYEEVIS